MKSKLGIRNPSHGGPRSRRHGVTCAIAAGAFTVLLGSSADAQDASSAAASSTTAPTIGPASPTPLAKKTTQPPVIVPATSTLKGEGIEGIDGLRSTFYVACKPDDVLDMLWDISRFQEIFPEIKRLKVLKREETLIDAEFGIDVTVAWVDYTLRRRLDQPHRRISWVEIGGDLEHVRGEWRVWPTDDPNVTKVRYSTFVEVNALVPTSMIRDGAMKAAKSLPDSVRRGCAKTAAAPAR